MLGRPGRGTHIDCRVVGQGISVLARALGDDVRQVSPDPEDAGSAREWLMARGAQKGGLEIRSDPPLVGAAQRSDSEPNRHVRSRHEYWPTDPTARTLELVAERRFDGALAGAERAQSESEKPVERRASEPAFKLLSTRGGSIGCRGRLRWQARPPWRLKILTRCGLPSPGGRLHRRQPREAVRAASRGRTGPGAFRRRTLPPPSDTDDASQ